MDDPRLDDPALPVEHLLGRRARDLVAGVLGPDGGEVVRTTPTGTSYHRGRSLTVRHATVVEWPDGRRTTERLVLSSGRRAPAGTPTVLVDGHHVVGWREPDDPWLPGLAPALDPRGVVDLLSEVGAGRLDAGRGSKAGQGGAGPARRGPRVGEHRGPTATDVRCRVRSYRPGRRAVVEVTGRRLHLFLKVVRPPAAEALHRLHEDLAGAVPVPRSTGWSADLGIVVLPARPGRTIRQVLSHGGALPQGRDLLALLDDLPGTDRPAGGAGAGWRREELTSHLAAVAPGLAERTAALAADLAPFEEAAGAMPAVSVHGDLYAAQVLVDGGRIVGLLDVDTFGQGRRVDDLATYLGHLAVLASARPDGVHRIGAHARRVLEAFDRTTDPTVLRARVAAVVLGLATGPFRVLEAEWPAATERRIVLAEEWLTDARAVAATHRPRAAAGRP